MENPTEAATIVNVLTKRQQQVETLKKLELGDNSDEIKKSIGKLSRWEKKRVRSGDKTVLFQRLGIAEEEDIDKLKKKFGVKGKMDEENIDEVLSGVSLIGRKRYKRKIK